jgi:hypothetical protein
MLRGMKIRRKTELEELEAGGLDFFHSEKKERRSLEVGL